MPGFSSIAAAPIAGSGAQIESLAIASTSTATSPVGPHKAARLTGASAAPQAAPITRRKRTATVVLPLAVMMAPPRPTRSLAAPVAKAQAAAIRPAAVRRQAVVPLAAAALPRTVDTLRAAAATSAQTAALAGAVSVSTRPRLTIATTHSRAQRPTSRRQAICPPVPDAILPATLAILRSQAAAVAETADHASPVSVSRSTTVGAHTAAMAATVTSHKQIATPPAGTAAAAIPAAAEKQHRIPPPREALKIIEPTLSTGEVFGGICFAASRRRISFARSGRGIVRLATVRIRRSSRRHNVTGRGAPRVTFLPSGGRIAGRRMLSKGT